MHRQSAILAIGTLVVALAPVMAASEPAGRDEFEQRLLDRAAAGDSDSVSMLIRGERFRTHGIFESLLADRLRDLVGQHPDSAAVRLRSARAIADAYAGVFADSFLVRSIRFHERLPAESVPAVEAAWSFYEELRALERTSRFAEAVESLPELRRLAAQAGDSLLAVRAGQLAVRYLHITGSYDEARAESEVVLGRARAIGDRVAQCRIQGGIGLLNQEQDRPDEAIIAYHQVLELARELKDDEMVVWALKVLGNAHRLAGDYAAALVEYEEALAIARRNRLVREEVSLLINAGALRDQLGESEEALVLLEEGLRIGRESGTLNRSTEVTAYSMMASICTHLGRYSRALTLQRDGLRVSEEAGLRGQIEVFQTQIGETCLLLGRPEDALPYFEEALQAFREMGIKRFEAVVLKDIALAEEQLEHWDLAIRGFEETLRVAEQTANPTVVFDSLLELGRVLAHRGDPDRAERVLRRALALADSLGGPLTWGLAERQLAAVHAARGEDAEARAFFDRAIARGREHPSLPLLHEVLVDKGRYLRRRGELAEADALLAEAMEAVERVRVEQAGELVRVGYLTRKKTIFAERVGVLFERGLGERGLVERGLGERKGPAPSAEHAEAFRTAERARARALLDVLARAGPDPGASVPPALRDQERELTGRLDVLQTQLSRAAAAELCAESTIDSLEALVAETVKEYRATLEEIGARSPAFGALAGQRAPLGVADVRRRVLGPDQVLLEYLVGEEESFVFLLGRERFRLARIPEGARELSARVDSLREALAEDLARATRTAETLHEILLAPLASEIPETARLLIIPDGPLFYLPFAALRDGTGWLVERHAIAYGPSASVLDPEIGRKPRRGGRSLLAVGNPTTFRAELLLASVREGDRWRFGELPYSEEEVRRVAGYFSNPVILVGPAATEESVVDAIGGSRYVHFATHGLLDEAEPLLSGLALAQLDDGSAEGILQVHEILGLDLTADLVALSACNTGLGRLAEGEGVLGLTRAFLHAGARCLLISLWEVSDRSTVDLMDSFYRAHIDGGLPLDVALQQAQVAAIGAGRSPREWGPFVVVGSVAPAGRDARMLWLAPAMVAIALLAAALAMRIWSSRSSSRPRRT